MSLEILMKKALSFFLIPAFLFISIGQSALATRTTSATGAGSLPRTDADSAGVFNVKTFGATGDGKTLDSPAINQAIEAAAAAGGGTVRFPAGTYRCFSIHL